jgi:uncharacterized protein with PIN domain
VNAAYVDASALVKLFKVERETAAFRAALGDWPIQVASELIREDLGAVFVYDTDLHAAARAHDLNPLAPH